MIQVFTTGTGGGRQTHQLKDIVASLRKEVEAGALTRDLAKLKQHAQECL
jgi:uncharacterized Fe-S cluster-containing MiaB family protein